MSKPTWYSIRKHSAITAAVLAAATAAGAPVPKSSAEILIYGEIGESWFSESVSAADFVREINALDVDSITVRINSIGGSVPDGIAIHNAIQRHKAHVTTVADGMALSAGSLILCAGDTVQAAENATVMVHAPWTIAMGNSAELREMADTLDVWGRSLSKSYAAKIGGKAEEVFNTYLDGKDHWFTADEAKAAGFIDEVVSAAPVAAMASFDLSRFHDVPERVKAQLVTRPAAKAAPSKKETAMTPEEIAAKAAADKAAIEAARREGAQAEAQRRADIEAQFKPFARHEGMAALQAACAADAAITAADAGAKILAHLAKDVTPAAGHYSMETIADERDKIVAAGSQALLARAGSVGRDGKRITMEGSNPYRGSTLLDMAKACLVRANVRTDGMDKMQIVAAAFTQSTSDFPILLENTMHKALQAGYAITPDTWSRWCKTGSVSDFRAHNRYRVSSLGNMPTVPEGAEFPYTAMPDGEKSSISVTTKGFIVAVTRQLVINDDLDALTGIPTAMGRAAKRTVEAAAYTSLALNSGLGPLLADGNPLFHNRGAGKNNITTGAAYSVVAIDADRVAMASMLDVGGNDFLDLRPAVALVPIGLGSTARIINADAFDPDATNKLQRTNISRGTFRDIVDTPRITGTRRYIFADPNEAPAMEMAFLDGNSEPFLEGEQGFDVDGSRWKVRLDFGTAGIDYRGAITNAGV
jgi:ATP-dependent Clp endopeptidase proteolytic subunit ClpP